MASIYANGGLYTCWGIDHNNHNRLRVATFLNSNDCFDKLGVRFTHAKLTAIGVALVKDPDWTGDFEPYIDLSDSYSIVIYNGFSSTNFNEIGEICDKYLNIVLQSTQNLHDLIHKSHAIGAMINLSFVFYTDANENSSLNNHQWNYFIQTISTEQTVEPSIFCPANGYTLNEESNNQTLIVDTMTLEDFKICAARKLNIEPEKIRVFTKTFEKVLNDEGLQITEKNLSCCYIQNIEYNGNFATQTDDGWMIIAVDGAGQKTNFWADWISGTGAFQMNCFIAERNY